MTKRARGKALIRIRKRKVRFSDVIVYISILAIVIYTIEAFQLQVEGGSQISPQLTIGWFAFWGVEVAALAKIKIEKVKKQK